jgi:hypothetical protein
VHACVRVGWEGKGEEGILPAEKGACVILRPALYLLACPDLM